MLHKGILKQWQVQAWAEWAEAIQSLKFYPASTDLQRQWNTDIDNRIEDILRFYGVDLSLDAQTVDMPK